MSKAIDGLSIVIGNLIQSLFIKNFEIATVKLWANMERRSSIPIFSNKRNLD
jgi:DNA-binding protein